MPLRSLLVQIGEGGMRWIVMVLALIVAPLPAAAQAAPQAAQMGVFPEWMLGRWCGLFNDLEYCMTLERGANGEVITGFTRQAGPEAPLEQISLAAITVEDGRLVLRSTGAGTLYREAPHGPDELVMENAIPKNVADGDALRIRYTRDRDQLTVEFGWDDGRTVSQSYGLTHGDGTEHSKREP